MKKALFLMALLAFSTAVRAQEPTSVEWLSDDWMDEFADDETYDDEPVGMGELQLEVLNELHENRINLNTATREDLARLPFLNDQQIEEICAYIYRYAPIRSLGELAMIESLDQNRRKLLCEFVYIDETAEKEHFPSWQQIAKYGKNELLATAKIPFYERAGDKNGYQGYGYKHWLRYNFQYGQYVKAGVVASQDAGEPWFSGKNSSGYDYYSYYLLLRKMGRLKTLVVGKYRLNMGMGLVMNNDFSFGKQATLQTLGRQSNFIKAHSSRSEANYLQGTAATVALIQGLDLTAFASVRKIDAILNNDSAHSIATILKTGYHRTQSELDRKHNSRQTVGGANVRFFKNGFHAGATAYYATLDRELLPNKKQEYRRYYPEGKHFWNVGVDYGYINYRFSLNGETATGDCGAIATLNSASFVLNSSLSLVALQRFYSYKYYSLFANSMSEGGSVQNESGVYVGAQWQAARHLKITAYTDIAYFAWPKYQANETSHSFDNMVSAEYSKGNFSLQARYRLKNRQYDNEEKNGLIYKNLHRGRMILTWKNGIWTSKTQADVAYSQYKDNSFGTMISQTTECLVRQTRLSASLSYFDTDDYDSRVYTYERSMLYTMSLPMFYGHGVRATLFAALKAIKNVDFIGKIGWTHYFDRDVIGSGLQKIEGRNQTDLDLQVRWKF